MKKFIPVGIVLVIIGLAALLVVAKYNSLVTLQEGVDSQWGNVENVYQRRADLVPNLVETVKGYAAHESETLTAVVEARAEATRLQTQLSPEALQDPQLLEKFQAAQGDLSAALARLMVVIERYPDLKANTGFLDLQAQLEGTENRIAVERRRFNEKAQAFNTALRHFPANLLAGMFSFQERAYFQAAETAQTAPQVDF